MSSIKLSNVEKKPIQSEKKKPIPFIIESDSEEESDEESEDKQDECCGCEGKFYWRHLNYSSDDKGTLYCDDCMPESDDEGEFQCSVCGCDGMNDPDDTCSKCLIEMCRKR